MPPRTSANDNTGTDGNQPDAPGTLEGTPDATPATPGEAPAAEPTDVLKYPKGEAPEEFTIQATVELRGDGAAQGAYNVLILDTEAMHILDSLGAEFGATVKNKNGDYWLAVKAGASARTKIRQAKSFTVLFTGMVRVNKCVNGQLRGELFAVTEAKPATLRNGGRVIERQTVDRSELETAATVATQAGGRGGMRGLLSNLSR